MAPPTRSRKHTIPQFNIMVVGFSGVGKSSFIRTLTRSLQLNKRDSMFQSPQSWNQPLQELTPFTVETLVDGEKLALTLIDTPGLHADYLFDKQLFDILGYIERQFDSTLAEETKVKRNPKAVDTQIHACLYIVDSNKTDLDEYDIRALKRLANRVNVIPVIGKSDTLTLAQRNRLKPAILRSIYNKHKIPLYGMPEEEEEDEGEEDKAATKDNKEESLSVFLQQLDYDQEDDEVRLMIDYLRITPFTFIACEEDPTTGEPLSMTTTGKQIQLGRDYGWGIIDCLGDDYSDFAKLTTILLNTHRRILISETVERYYEQYRTERLLQRRITRMKSMEVNKKFLEDLQRL
ncbi:Septin-type guanine nucleotide-binding (G) domain-containing protein [Chlamydoabsidia padenii]|nr:Septin-type guanine nucleotide-binding (G) domain-containing protein [Chlamydoabsidia padenii]